MQIIFYIKVENKIKYYFLIFFFFCSLYGKIDKLNGKEAKLMEDKY